MRNGRLLSLQGLVSIIEQVENSYETSSSVGQELAASAGHKGFLPNVFPLKVVGGDGGTARLLADVNDAH